MESNFNLSDLKESENECSKPTSKYKNFSFSLRLDWINKYKMVLIVTNLMFPIFGQRIEINSHFL